MCDFVEKYPLLAPYKDAILATTQTIAPFTWQEWQGEGRPPLWQSHLGGVPYLPLGDEYPYTNRGYPFALFAQINFAEMPPVPDFPTEGILQIFVDGMDDSLGLVGDGERPLYRYYPNVITDDSALQQNLPNAPLQENRQNPPCVLQFQQAQTQYMTYSDMRYYDVIVDKNGNRLHDDDEADDQFFELSCEFDNYIGGYHRTCQYDPRDRFVKGDEPGNSELIRLKQTRLLLQISDELPIFNYYDLSVQLFVHPDDLRRRDFSGVFSNIDCD